MGTGAESCTRLEGLGQLSEVISKSNSGCKHVAPMQLLEAYTLRLMLTSWPSNMPIMRATSHWSRAAGMLGSVPAHKRMSSARKHSKTVQCAL